MNELGTVRKSWSPGVAIVLVCVLILQAPFAAGQGVGSPGGAGQACRPKSIVVVRTGSATTNAAEFEHALGSALARHRCFRTVDVVDFLEAGMGEGQARLETARDSADAGIQAFLSMRLQEARALLAEAVDAYTDGFAYLSYEGPFVEALMYLGACEAALSNPGAAIRAFRIALGLKPGVRADDYSTLPEVTRAFEAARAEAAGGVSGALIVDSRPQGVEVLLDGRRFLGVTPLDAPDVPAGPHFVVLRKAGYIRKTVRVDVPAGGTAAVAADEGALDEARRKPLYDMAMRKLASPEGNDIAGIEDIKALFLADLALVVRVDESARGMSARVALWDLATMQRVFEGAEPREGVVSVLGVGAAEAVVNAALAVVEERAEVRESGAATYQARSSGGIWSRWWFWTAVGAVVLGGVTATVLLTRPKEKAPGLPRDGNGAVIIRF